MDEIDKAKDIMMGSKTAVAIRKAMKRLIPELFAINREPITQRDRRWDWLIGTIAQFYVETLKYRVEKRVGNIRQKKQNRVTCLKCFWWKQRETIDGEIIKSDKYGRCTNPKEREMVLAFNPYDYDDNKERSIMAEAKFVYRKSSSSCRSALRKVDIKI